MKPTGTHIAPDSSLAHDGAGRNDESRGGLSKALGVFAVMASAVAAEYGSGVNTLLSNALGAYPGITFLLPLAVVVAGLVLLPSVMLYARFARVISSAGSAYVWMTTTLGGFTGFVVGFVYFVGVLGSMGFLAYVFSTFIATFCQDLGATDVATWCVSPIGRVVTGVILIVTTLLIHLRGVTQYGKFISILFFGVLIAAAVTVFYGLTTSPDTVIAYVGAAIGRSVVAPSTSTPSAGAFFAVVTLFVYLYGGISAAPSLGGESQDAGKTLAKGLFQGWLVALVLYTVVAFSLFRAVPWWLVNPAVKAGQGALMTIPGLVGIMAPWAVSVSYKALIIVVAGKTTAPLMFDCSRNLYAWAIDGHVPKCFARTNARNVPAVALVTVAILTVAFLAETVYGGFQIGVAIRAVSLVLVSVMVGLGALRVTYARKFSQSEIRLALLKTGDITVIAVLSILFGLVLIYFGVVQHGVPFWLQPGVQGAIAAMLAVFLFMFSRKRPVLA